jgi:ERI1 exoribonuclease 3
MAERSEVNYFLVLDFEATCDDSKKIKPQEIIEFPVLKINARTMKEESFFHSYVMPTYHPKLTPFCTQLTGITQEMVDDKPSLKTCLSNFHKWLGAEGLLNPGVSFCFVTCGDWDLKTMLPGQCTAFGLHHPEYMKRWMNIKFVFQDLMGQKAYGMPNMLDKLGLKLAGRHHSGIDDSRNIAQILVKLSEIAKATNYVLGPTSEYKSYRKKHIAK